MLTDTMKQSLLDLGIGAEDYKALEIIPMVYVAWADGAVAPLQRSRVLEFARAVGISPTATELIEHHLTRRPSDDYFHEAFRLLRSLADLTGELDVDPDDFVRVASWCEAIARVQDDKVGGPESVGARERGALEVVARQLGLDPKTSFASLLDDLEGDAAQPSGAAPPVSGQRADSDVAEESADRDTSLRRYRHLVRRENEAGLPPSGEDGGLV